MYGGVLLLLPLLHYQLCTICYNYCILFCSVNDFFFLLKTGSCSNQMLVLRFLLHFSCNFFTLVFLFFSGTYVECLSCDTPLGKIPGESIPYSDHEAVVAKLHVFKSLEGTTFVFLVCNDIIIYLLFKNYFINKIARSIINTNYRKLVTG